MKTTPIPVELVLVAFSQFLSWLLRAYFNLGTVYASLLSELFKVCSSKYFSKLTWLALGEDHVVRSRRVEQLTAL